MNKAIVKNVKTTHGDIVFKSSGDTVHVTAPQLVADFVVHPSRVEGATHYVATGSLAHKALVLHTAQTAQKAYELFIKQAVAFASLGKPKLRLVTSN